MKTTARIPVTNRGADYSPSPDAAPASSAAQELLVPAEHAGLRLDQSVARLLPAHSRNRLQGWLREGRIRVDGAARDPKDKVWGGERLQVHEAEAAVPRPDRAEPIGLSILFEDAHVIVLDKPPGLVVHPGSGVPSGTLLNALLHHAPCVAGLPRAGIVHRLDKDTSGLLVVAKTLEAQTDLVRQLQARSVRRQYAALVHGVVERGGSVEAALGRHPTQRTRMAVLGAGRHAVTHYAPLERFARATLVQCDLETGRTHQIRVHMTHLGHPLVGDPTYGRRKSGSALLDAFARQALHAMRLGLIHPASGAAMEWQASLPADFAALLDGLRAESAAARHD
ncbi:MAG: 23S rRNA pseudouridine(1911/1915/1917) synthase RluD [Sterolibacteriaceae bacterium]|nr:23S rRNA pseudouridine(1911/1915/1917) synthase RluD [Sterolibacteriaceae bacterium]